MNGRYSLNLPIDLKKDAEKVAKQQKISLNQLILWSLTEKVTSLKENLNDPEFPSISYKRDTSNQLVPVITGKGIRVQTIVVAAIYWKETAEEICKQYNLTKKMVEEVMGFYSTHKIVIDALIAENESLESAHGQS